MGITRETIANWFWGIMSTTIITTNTTWFIQHGINLTDWETVLKLVFSGCVSFFTCRHFYLAPKNKSDNQVHLHFDHLILAGNDLLKDKHYNHALKFYNKALLLNYDNELAQLKISECKKLIEDGN
jgi:hypothetical protein